jgi:ribosomal-protein-alanine N-acetyltransferase
VELRIEPLGPEHADALFEPLSEPRLYEFVPDDPPASRQALEARLRHWAAGPRDGSERWLNYLMWAGPAPVGTLQATVQADRVALLAYLVFAPQQRRGYAAHGCRWLIGELFAAQPVDTVRALIDTRNTPSIRLAEALGLRRVGLIREADVFKGRSSDEFVYERTRAP